MSFSLSASTRIFGMFGFGEHSRVKAIRHEFRPTISASYSPNMNAGNYYNSVTDAAGTVQRTSYYTTSIYGPFPDQRFGGLSFSLDNNITMKVRDRKDTSAKADKKISILDGLTLTGGYNFLADSLRFQPLNLSARSTLFEKVNITGNANFDLYDVNEFGNPVNRLVWRRKPLSLGTLRSANISMSSSFKGGDKGKKLTAGPGTLDPSLLAQGITQDEYQAEAAYIQNNPSEFVDFTIPWSVDLSYSFLLSRVFNVATGRFEGTLSQSTVINASANLTQKWKVGANTTYDITTHKIGVLSAYLSRDLHCWQLAINLSPIGRTRFFSINISPKSPILRDLKVNRTRSFTDF